MTILRKTNPDVGFTPGSGSIALDLAAANSLQFKTQRVQQYMNRIRLILET
jgi:hypothetical protein